MKFVAFLKMIDALCEESILSRDPADQNRVLIYRAGVSEEKYGVSEGWFSQNIHDLAEELFHDRDSFNNLREVLSAKGYTLKFSSDGEFEKIVS